MSFSCLTIILLNSFMDTFIPVLSHQCYADDEQLHLQRVRLVMLGNLVDTAAATHLGRVYEV